MFPSQSNQWTHASSSSQEKEVHVAVCVPSMNVRGNQCRMVQNCCLEKDLTLDQTEASSYQFLFFASSIMCLHRHRAAHPIHPHIICRLSSVLGPLNNQTWPVGVIGYVRCRSTFYFCFFCPPSIWCNTVDISRYGCKNHGPVFQD